MGEGDDSATNAANAAAAAAAIAAAAKTAAADLKIRHQSLIRAARLADEEMGTALEGADLGILERSVLTSKAMIAELEEEILLHPTTQAVEDMKAMVATSKNSIKSAEQMMKFARNVAKAAPGPSPGTADHEVKITWNPVPFSGVMKEWIAWWDIFRTSVHDSKRYSNSTKVKCLMDCLRGSARNVVKSITPTSENYEKIVDALHVAYNNPAALESIFIDELKEIPEASDARACRENVNLIKGILTNLSMLGKEIKTDSTQIRKIVLNKFPEGILTASVHEINKVTGGKFTYSAQQLIDELDSRISTGEHIQLNREAQSYVINTTALAINSHVNKGRLPLKRPHNNETPSIKCILCGKEHHAALCQQYPDLASRRKRIAELHRCFRCTGANHNRDSCQVKVLRCDNCTNPDHVTIFCPNSNQAKRARKNMRSG
ncbi:uncharacterized protein LOC135840339 isoform X3 [Planococcus citri]|uniref:uncharacterized protein LOC135840339 isoform X3 n=1 Tax=Planococcus citri TaxID=170843 RepID=UPI0031F92462